MSGLYMVARNLLLQGDVAMDTDTIRAQIYGTPFTFDDTDTTPVDLTGALSTPQLLDVTAIDSGRVIVADVTFPNVGGTTAVTALVAYRDGGTPATSRLLCCIDRRADTAPMSIAPNGADITFSFTYLLKI